MKECCAKKTGSDASVSDATELKRTIRIGKATTVDFGQIWVIEGMYNASWADDVLEWRVCSIGPLEMNGFRKMSIETWLGKLWKLRGIERELEAREAVSDKLRIMMGH